MKQVRRFILPMTGVLVVLLAAGAWFFLRDTSDPKLTLTDDLTAATDTPAEPEGTDLSGTWTVVPGAGAEATTAGYRVEETVAAGVASTTATGRTTSVTGAVTVEGDTVTAADLTVDMTTLASDKSVRDTVLKTMGIQTDSHPTATFTLTEPVTLPELTVGTVVELTASGDLTLHGTTKAVTVDLALKQTASGFVLQTELELAMRDYGIEPPSVAGIVSVDDHGSLELLVALERAAG